MHVIVQEMTMSWCQKRAELVYKCIKGFMMEMTSWGGAEMKNMQFLVPKVKFCHFLVFSLNYKSIIRLSVSLYSDRKNRL